MAIEVSRIEREFILKHITDTKGKAEVIQGNRLLSCTISKTTSTEMLLLVQNVQNGIAEAGRIAEVFFFFKGTRISGKTVIRKVTDKECTVDLPSNLWRDLSRNFERIRPEEQIGVSILLEGQTLKLDFPMFQDDAPGLTPPELNVKFDASKIADLLKGFREKAKTFANEHKIVMFRERKPEMITEHLVAWSGKILMLPLSDAESPIRKREENRKDILKETDVRAITKSSGRNHLALSQELSTHVDVMFQRKIWHELYVPILYHQYVIGYVYLLRSDLQVSGFSPSVVDFVRQFSRILAYSLASNNYFTGTYVRESYNRNDLVDISASGMLFSLSSTGPSLDILSDIDLTLHIRDRNIPVKARIMRRFQEGTKLFVGAKFLEVATQDTEYLLEFLYGTAQDGSYSDEAILPESN